MGGRHFGRRGMAIAAILALVAAVGPRVTPSPVSAVTCQVGFHCGEIKLDPTGLGAGTVRGENIDCTLDGDTQSGDCTGSYQYQTPSKVVELIVTPGPWSAFVTDTAQTIVPGNSASVYVVVAADGTIAFKEILFKLWYQDLTLKRAGAGSGIIHHTFEGVVCPPECTVSYLYGETGVIVAAVPDAGSIFVSWDGPCAGQGAACQFDMPKSQTMTVTFGLAPTATATPHPATPKPTLQPTSAPTALATTDVLPSLLSPSAEPSAAGASQTTATIGPAATAGGPATSAQPASPGSPTGTDPGFGSGLLIGLLIAAAVVGAGGLFAWRRRPPRA